jgi:hypothetical protein
MFERSREGDLEPKFCAPETSLGESDDRSSDSDELLL